VASFIVTGNEIYRHHHQVHEGLGVFSVP